MRREEGKHSSFEILENFEMTCISNNVIETSTISTSKRKGNTKGVYGKR